MSKSLYQIAVQGSGTYVPPSNVLVTSSPTAITSAIDAALAAAGSGATLQNANMIGGRAIDYIVPAAISPVTDVAPQVLFQIFFQNGQPGLLVLANAQSNAGVVTPAPDVAVNAIVPLAGLNASVNGLSMMGTVTLSI